MALQQFADYRHNQRDWCVFGCNCRLCFCSLQIPGQKIWPAFSYDNANDSGRNVALAHLFGFDKTWSQQHIHWLGGCLFSNDFAFLHLDIEGYFDTVPKSLEEAARIDGCTEFGAFYRILLPLSKPSLAIVFLFNFTQAWNEYLVASTILQDSRLRTWTLGLYELQGNFNSEWGLFAAGSVLISVPVVLLFLYSSKYMISGLTLGGVKG